MFEPGHLHLSHAPMRQQDVAYTLDLTYEKCQDPTEGSCVQFNLSGAIAGKSFEDQFLLTRDSVFNFASKVDRIMRKHGLPNTQALPLIEHKQYDLMFANLREQLDLHSGEAMQPEHIR